MKPLGEFLILGAHGTSMPQYFFRTLFKGTAYHGWQVQDNAPTVQGRVNEALRHLFGLDEARTLGCGRTDKGVHAEEFYFSFWAGTPFDTDELLFKMNNFLPSDIAVRSIHPVSEEAHVRFDPEQRTYLYRIHRSKDPFLQDRSYYFHRALDTDPMQEAAALLLNYDHFGAFARTGRNTGTDICRVQRAEWSFGEDRFLFRISADRFLRGMVRGIVGTMLDLGIGRYGIERFKEIIASRDRKRAGDNAPARGLFLKEVRYPYSLGP